MKENRTSFNSLKFKIIFFLIIIILIIFLINNILIIYIYNNNLKNSIFNNSKSLGVSILTLINRTLKWSTLSDTPGITDFIINLKEKNPNISDIWVLNENGKIILSTDKKYENKTLTDKKSKEMLALNDVKIYIYSDVFDTAVPIFNPYEKDINTDKEKRVGLIRIRVFKTELNQAVTYSLLYSSLVSIIIIALLSIFLS
ncbi:MAG: PDC sensor domain-containing protein, partial [Spirochaetes bacterium]|nr:PDC sensor domain-containing protein [Spirochaetota bacterium]